MNECDFKTWGLNASRTEAAKLKRRLLGWTAQGGAVALLTLTQSHCLNDALGVLWSRLESGWAALVRGSGWTADKQAHGVRGYVRTTELVHNAAAGWNVHFHVILLLDQELDQPRMHRLRASLAARFARGVERSGGHAAVDRQDLRPMTPGSEKRLANYLFKGTRSYWSMDGSRSNCRYLWIKIFYAASFVVVSSSGRSTSWPFSNFAPARTSATRWGALTARQRDWAASISL